MPRTLRFLPLLAASAILSATSSKHDQFTQAQSPTQSDISQTDPQTTIRVNSNLVVLSVSVKDANGTLVPDLQKHEFHVFDDNVEQSIDVSPQTPFHFRWLFSSTTT